ncbi:MAG TPA: CoA-binding protein [Actinomycetota bacterium]|nr:CoA-binding protein [Actinomycetota bacterium]
MDAYADDATIRKILSEYRTFAVVGCSANPSRASFRVATFLMGHGYRVIPVNPNECDNQILKQTCYERLSSIPFAEEVEVVDIFRRSEFAGSHVDEAIELGAKAVWMQLGVIDQEAAERAAAAGLDVVMDRCPAIEYRRLFGTAKVG